MKIVSAADYIERGPSKSPPTLLALTRWLYIDRLSASQVGSHTG